MCPRTKIRRLLFIRTISKTLEEDIKAKKMIIVSPNNFKTRQENKDNMKPIDQKRIES